MPDHSLADKIRDKLAARRLPRDEPIKARVRHGSDRLCLGCVGRIWLAQVEYELEIEDGKRYWLHVGCHGLWVAERYRRRWADLRSRAVPSDPRRARGEPNET